MTVDEPAKPRLLPLRSAVWAALAVTLAWTIACVALARRCGFPQPSVHDEFSYLLGADTFLHGRMVNPAHPLAGFFESPHILVRPVYASKYQPGQSLALALGEKLFGSPYYGVVMGGALMMFLFTLTLAAWSAPAPAMGISTFLGLLFLPPMYWVYSYWGGCLAAAGGAAVLLSAALYRRGRAGAAGALFAAGAVILFLTRPYEGGAFTAAVLVVGAVHLRRERGRAAAAGVRSFLLAAAPIAIAGLLWTGIYDAAVTGSPFRLPYMVHDAQYNSAPVWWFLPVRQDRHYTHPRLAKQFLYDVSIYESNRAGRLGVYRPFSAGFHSLFDTFGSGRWFLLLVPFAWRDWRIRWLAAVAGLSVIALGLEVFHFAHYAAPATLGVALLFACAAESSWRFRAGSRPVGAILTGAVFVVALVYPLAAALGAARDGDGHRGVGDLRAALIAGLPAQASGHLVIVHYPDPGWDARDEWVYNGADIDAQKVIFAHDLGTQQNAALLRYYANRQVWLLTFAHGQYCLAPYSSADAGGSPVPVCRAGAEASAGPSFTRSAAPRSDRR